ncbi:MAG: hypothetical protein AB7T49_09735 [Oligoflexales bacterium]
MAKIIEFKKKPTTIDKQAIKLLKFADEIDAAVLRQLKDDQLDPKEVIGVLAHRLGKLLGYMEDKDELWEICRRVLKKQADLDESV